MPIGAVGGAILGGSVLSGVLGASASKSAASAQAKGDAAAIAEQRRQFDLSRQDLAPWRGIGSQAINQLGSLYGFTNAQPQQGITQLPQGGMTDDRLFPQGLGGRFGGISDKLGFGSNMMLPPGSQPEQQMQSGTGMAGFFASPDYNFRRDEGMRGLERSAAARGGAFSGNALRGLSGFNSNLAAGEFGNYFNRLSALSGIGQSATNTGVQAGQQSAANIGNLLSSQGASRASGIMGQANSIGGALNSGINNYLLYRGGYFGV